MNITPIRTVCAASVPSPSTSASARELGRLRRCTERRKPCVEAYLALAAAIVTLRALLRAAWYRYRRTNRPRSPRIR